MVAVKRLAPFEGRATRKPCPGWLSLWYNGGEDTQTPSRKYFCDRREVQGILRYWEGHVVGDLRHRFDREDGEQDTLSKILEDKPVLTALGRILA